MAVLFFYLALIFFLFVSPSLGLLGFFYFKQDSLNLPALVTAPITMSKYSHYQYPQTQQIMNRSPCHKVSKKLNTSECS